MNAPVKPSKLIKGATGDWEVVIGLEIHAQVTSNSKLFSGSSTEFGGAPNAHVSLVDAAMPGMLPVINEECVTQAVRTGLGLKAQINLRSTFDRKNYFYPDLPQGYQISQYKSPIVGEGTVIAETEDGESFSVGIERLHLEQDAGKLLHDQQPTMTFVDLNRSGVALMEIVSKPDLRSSDQARAYVTKLRSILRYLGTCDGDMEKGSLRADVNVSVRRPGEPFGTRCEHVGAEWLKAAGAELVEVSLPHTKYALPAYYIVAPAEASSNLARYDGVRYGLREQGRNIIEMYENTRAAGFGPEVRRRVLIGTYVLSAGYYDAYYLRAQKVRTLIKKDFEDCFAKGVNAILTPATPSAAFGIGEKDGADPVEMYLNDIFTVTVNMAGLPGIAVPAGKDVQGLPLGLQLIGRPFDEETLFSLGEVVEQAAGSFTPARWWARP